MNIEETKKAIEVMQAFVDGKAVEVRQRAPGAKWEIVMPSWNWVSCEYRIKPQPKEIWVNEHADGSGTSFPTASQADLAMSWFMAVRKAVHYREVIEE